MTLSFPALSFLVTKNMSTFDYLMKTRFKKNLHPAEEKELPLQKKGDLPQVCLSLRAMLMEGLRPMCGGTLDLPDLH